ncbi:MAG TPA: hypothetical protein VHF51_09350 [Solirubrobacteraceae bacterium]|nr:hypothetical protein [Solirubrobacteraceae bacterium]
MTIGGPCRGRRRGGGRRQGSCRSLVDRALALVGGAAFRSGHPIRAYRDVRAGAFMNPLASGRAYELIGQVALGLRVSLS